MASVRHLIVKREEPDFGESRARLKEVTVTRNKRL